MDQPSTRLREHLLALRSLDNAVEVLGLLISAAQHVLSISAPITDTLQSRIRFALHALEAGTLTPSQVQRLESGGPEICKALLVTISRLTALDAPSLAAAAAGLDAASMELERSLPKIN